jgi:hypothetical protein
MVRYVLGRVLEIGTVLVGIVRMVLRGDRRCSAVVTVVGSREDYPRHLLRRGEKDTGIAHGGLVDVTHGEMFVNFSFDRLLMYVLLMCIVDR